MAEETLTLRVPAIHCAGCLGTTDTVLAGVGARLARGDAESKRVTVCFDASRVSRAQILAALEEAGFPAEEV